MTTSMTQSWITSCVVEEDELVQKNFGTPHLFAVIWIAGMNPAMTV